MPAIRTRLDSGSPEFNANARHHRALAEDLKREVAKVAQGGGAEAQKKHTARGKLLPRERVRALLDPGTPFLELSQLAAHGMYDGDAPAAGLVTGIGRVEGREVVIVANDATVKGGTYYPMTVKKHLRAQEIARAESPAVHLSRGLRRRVPAAAGRGLSRQGAFRAHLLQPGAHLSARGIPQVAVVMGSCTAGGAYVPAMCDESIIVKNQGTIFLGGPPLVKAATGEVVTAEELGGGDVHSRISGVTDHLADDDAMRSRSRGRSFANRQPGAGTRRQSRDCNRRPLSRRRATLEPLYPAEDLYGIIPADPAQALRRARGHRAPGRRQRVPRVQGALRHDARRRLRAPRGHAGRHPRQQRHPVLGVGAEGRALHRALLPARHPAPLPAEHHGLHGRQEVRARRHRQGRREDGDGGFVRAGAQAHADHSAARSAPATTACAGAPSTRASCGRGPTRASR